MDFFWSNVFDYFKDRRVAAVFFGSLMIAFGLLVAGVILYQLVGGEILGRILAYGGAVLGLVFAGWVWREIAQARRRRRDRYKVSPLSRDELNKARSKLKANR